MLLKSLISLHNRNCVTQTSADFAAVDCVRDAGLIVLVVSALLLVFLHLKGSVSTIFSVDKVSPFTTVVRCV